MNRSLKHTILKELNTLIDYSCEPHTAQPVDFSSLHKALIKKYFQAENVSFDLENQMVLLEVMVDLSINETAQVQVPVDYARFNDFLKSCIEDNHSSLRYYKNMLTYYHVIKPISA
ncbi:hypothetical protein [Dokdonia sp. Asnod2-E02]|uniref:hypothetical protein n=1 Tax=Dokdonia sp. Asnod2-E02 TaxID=3160574 RepID=UPI003863CF89